MSGRRDRDLEGLTDQSVWCFLAIIVVGLIVYANSLVVPFLLDDQYAILENPHIRHLWPLWEALAPAPRAADSWRPLISLSLAINFAISGFQVWSYHLVNVAIHLASALVLFGIVRRTLAGHRLGARYGAVATPLAFVTALLWMVHPLQTQSVTYIIQRAESLMGLFYLLTLYCTLRSDGSPRPLMWAGAAVLSCVLGIFCKPVIVTAPLLVWVYDGIFLSPSFSRALHKRRRLYVALAATWILAAMLVSHLPHPERARAGFAFKDITPLEYLLTQPGVILHYLRLVLWPHPLCFDYAWPIARTLQAILWPTLVIVPLVCATGWLVCRRHPLGFLGAWFFGVLAPTSSFIPIADLAAEHRVYLPLAAVVAGAVLSIRWLLCRFVRLPSRQRKAEILMLAIVIVVFEVLTIRRNGDYRSAESIWRDTIAKRPANGRAYIGLGNALVRQGRWARAVTAYTEALQLKPNDDTIHNNLGVALYEQGQLDEAKKEYTEALRLDPSGSDAHNNLGVVLIQQGHDAEAIAHFVEALRLSPDHVEAKQNLERARSLHGH